MAQHLRRDPPKGSTIIIALMFVAVVAYVALDVWVYATYHSWIPYDASALVAACFVAETTSLAKLKMAKESGRKPDYSRKQVNSFMSRLGVTGVPDFTEEAVAAGEDATGGVGNG